MNRPKLIVHQFASADGRLTLAPDVLLLYGDERWQAAAGQTEGIYRDLMQHYQPQVILEGSGSLVAETALPEPLPPVNGDAEPLYRDYLPEEVVARPGARGWFTVVDGRGRIRWMYKEFPGEEWAGWHLLVLVCRDTPAEYLAYLRQERIPYLVAGEERVDLGRALEKLYTRLEVRTVVSTAGGRLNGALLRAGLIDALDLVLFPALIGGTDTPALFDSPALQPGELPTRLELVSAETQAEGRVRLRYQVIHGSHS